MNWNKINRWIHREFGYFFFGMTLIYGISGIALNHNVANKWNPAVVTKSESFSVTPVSPEQINKEWINDLISEKSAGSQLKQYYFADSTNLMIYLRDGHISLNPETGKGTVIKVRNRPFFREISFLHYNKPKQLWLWFSDIYAGALVLIAITGLFLVKGRKGIRGRGGLLVIAGIIIPLIFLAFYLWF